MSSFPAARIGRDPFRQPDVTIHLWCRGAGQGSQAGLGEEEDGPWATRLLCWRRRRQLALRARLLTITGCAHQAARERFGCSNRAAPKSSALRNSSCSRVRKPDARSAGRRARCLVRVGPPSSLRAAVAQWQRQRRKRQRRLSQRSRLPAHPIHPLQGAAGRPDMAPAAALAAGLGRRRR